METGKRVELELEIWDDFVGSFEPSKVLKRIQSSFPTSEIDFTDRHQVQLLRLLELWTNHLPDDDSRRTIERQAWSTYKTCGPSYQFVVPFSSEHRIRGGVNRWSIWFHLPDDAPNEIRDELIAFLKSLRMGEPKLNDGIDKLEQES